MLGLTSYQEALRAVGRLMHGSSDVRVVEHAAEGWLEVGGRRLEAADLEELVVASVAQRGEHVAAGDISDLLRAVGLALDEVHALGVSILLSAEGLRVQYTDRSGGARELSYASDELDALRRSAVARRNGRPLRRILILQSAPEHAENLVELLVAEFAVQALPTAYARAIAATSDPPDLILAQLSVDTVEAVQRLRSGARTGSVPILVVDPGKCGVDQRHVFAAGADDALQEPIQPAQLRARIRTLLLRGRGHGVAVN
jgi:CheY-like chemotaxis protein